MIVILQLNLFGEPTKIKAKKEVDLQSKIKRAVLLLQSVAKGYDGDIEIAYSGGKDSDVILHLAQMAGIRYRVIYHNTTIDPPGTIQHALANGAEVIRPEHSFFQLIELMGLPNRFQRHCCRYLKEFKTLDKVEMGIRKAESIRRNKSYAEPTECRYYGAKIEQNHVEAIYPILEWTDKDVVDFIEQEHINIHPLYRYKSGVIDPRRRLGCMCCPLVYYKKRLRAFKERPGMVRAYCRAAEKYRLSHPEVDTVRKYADVYQWFFREVFFNKQKKWELWFEANKTSAFGITDYRRYLMDYFKIDLPEIKIEINKENKSAESIK